MKTGYVIAQHKNATDYFTTTSSYDRPRWLPITEASVYQTAEIAQQAISKLWKNGAYSAKLIPISEIYNEPNTPIPPDLDDDEDEYKDSNIESDLGSEDSDNEYDDEDEPEMKAGLLDDESDEDEINLDDESDDESDDQTREIEKSSDFKPSEKEFNDEYRNNIGSSSKSRYEENEQSNWSPLEKNMMKNKRSIMPNGNGPVKEGISQNLRNTQSNVPLTKSKGGEGHRGNVKGPQKISDEEVREMRRMHEVEQKSKTSIYAKWKNVEERTINQILNYSTRLSPSCEIDYKEKTKRVTEDNKTPVIKYKQQVGDPSDVDFTKGIDSLHNPNKTPSDIITALKDSIKEFQAAADYNNGKDDSQSSMAMTIVSALEDILTDLQQDTIEGLKAAQIRITSYMNPITSHFPPTVIDYLYKSGRQPLNLKNTFYDNWDIKRKEDQDY